MAEARKAIEREEKMSKWWPIKVRQDSKPFQVLLSDHDSISEMTRKVRDGAIERDRDAWLVLNDEDI